MCKKERRGGLVWSVGTRGERVRGGRRMRRTKKDGTRRVGKSDEKKRKREREKSRQRLKWKCKQRQKKKTLPRGPRKPYKAVGALVLSSHLFDVSTKAKEKERK